MRRTILRTPIISHFFILLAWLIAKCFGWRFPTFNTDVKKAVVIGAPHTSNWDFVLMLVAVFIWRWDVHWIGKHTLFTGPFGPVMRWLGGIAIDRRSKQNFVAQMVEHFNNHEEFVVVIAPEGTRSAVEQWKTGFYHMAVNAEVPIAVAAINYQKKQITIEEVAMPSGDIDADIQRYQDIYSKVPGRFPEKFHGYKGPSDS